MPDHEYVIRNYSHENIDEFIDFCRITEVFGTRDRAFLFSYIEKKFRRPHYDPEKDMFLAFWRDRIVGFFDMTPELRIGRVILDGLVHPSHREKGVGKQMIQHALRRAERLGAEIIHVCVPEKRKAAGAILEKWGFHPVRRFLNLEIDIPIMLAQVPVHSDVLLRYLRKGEEEQLAVVQNTCFSGTWGFCPNTVKEIGFYLEWTDSQVEDVIVAESKQEWNLIGYCWPHRVRTRSDSPKKGRIHMFGVIPSYRGKGVGRRLLIRGLQHLKEKEAQCVELTVDEENNPALSLYEHLGFKTYASLLWYERKL